MPRKKFNTEEILQKLRFFFLRERMLLKPVVRSAYPTRRITAGVKSAAEFTQIRQSD
jgi:hypothetical protein